MRIIIDVIAHKNQRYPTVGDWQFDGNLLCIKASDTGDERSSCLIAIHELVEALLCRWDGVSEESVNDFDMKHLDLGEPGESPHAPYHKQHVTADLVERIVAQAAGISWNDHNDRVEALDGPN